MRFSALFLSLLALVAQPAAAASSPSLSSLEQQLNSLVAGKSADVGIAALDLNSGETVSIKGNTPFPMASTVKVAVAALYLAQVDQRAPLARRHHQRPVGAQPDEANAGPQRQSGDRHPARRPRRAARGPRLAAGQWRDGPSRRPHHRRAPAQQARPLGPAGFEHAGGDGRPAEAHLQGRADQARKPQLSCST